MNRITLACLGLLMFGLAACQETPSDPGPTPDPATMSFKQGARYEFTSYRTSASTGLKDNSSERRRIWSVVSDGGVAHGRSNVGIYVDSVFAGGGIITIADTVYLQQQPGTNDVYRYASLVPELDFAGTSIIGVDLGKTWMHEARLNASTARWFVGEAADTVQMDISFPGFRGVKIGVTDSAVASASESITIDGNNYTATKTTHRLRFAISVIADIPILGTRAIEVKSETMNRTTWTVPQLAAIVREDREGKLINVTAGNYGGVTVPGFELPIPGYYSLMTKVLATGNAKVANNSNSD